MSKRPADSNLQSQNKQPKTTSTPKPTASASKPAISSFFSLRKSGQPLPPLANNPLNFPPKPQGAVRLSCWNVRSARDCNSEKKGRALRKYVEADDPDVLILAEVKWPEAATHAEMEWIRPRYKHRSFSKYTAMFSKTEPLSVTQGLPDWQTSDPQETRDRCITFEFEHCFVVGTYVQNSGENRKFMPKRLAWNADFHRYLSELQEKKPVLWGGDWNVVTSRDDLQWSSKNWDINPGARVEEREGHEKLLREVGLVDTWKLKNKGKKEFSHTSGRYGAWRIDGFIVSEKVVPRVLSAEIRHAVFKEFPNASDHWPSVIDFEGKL